MMHGKFGHKRINGESINESIIKIGWITLISNSYILVGKRYAQHIQSGDTWKFTLW